MSYVKGKGRALAPRSGGGRDLGTKDRPWGEAFINKLNVRDLAGGAGYVGFFMASGGSSRKSVYLPAVSVGATAVIPASVTGMATVEGVIPSFAGSAAPADVTAVTWTASGGKVTLYRWQGTSAAAVTATIGVAIIGVGG